MSKTKQLWNDLFEICKTDISNIQEAETCEDELYKTFYEEYWKDSGIDQILPNHHFDNFGNWGFYGSGVIFSDDTNDKFIFFVSFKLNISNVADDDEVPFSFTCDFDCRKNVDRRTIKILGKISSVVQALGENGNIDALKNPHFKNFIRYMARLYKQEE